MQLGTVRGTACGYASRGASPIVHEPVELGHVEVKQLNTVLREMTRSKLIQFWFATMSLVVAAAVALGVTVTIGTAAILVALSLVPPAIVLALWPGGQPMTAADVLYGRDRRDE